MHEKCENELLKNDCVKTRENPGCGSFGGFRLTRKYSNTFENYVRFFLRKLLLNDIIFYFLTPLTVAFGKLYNRRRIVTKKYGFSLEF